MPTEISGSTGVNKIQDNTIVNADINSSAAIAGSKLVMPTGSVLQVVQGSYVASNQLSTTATTQTATGYSVSITPTTSGNKILAMCLGKTYHGDSNAWGAVQIKDVTNSTFSDNHTQLGRDAAIEEHWTIYHLFTSTSTSQHTYELYQGSCDIGTKTYRGLLMILMEVAG